MWHRGRIITMVTNQLCRSLLLYHSIWLASQLEGSSPSSAFHDLFLSLFFGTDDVRVRWNFFVSVTKS